MQVVRSTLVDLGKALEGKVVMNGDLEDVMLGLSVGKIPAIWMKSSYVLPSLLHPSLTLFRNSHPVYQ